MEYHGYVYDFIQVRTSTRTLALPARYIDRDDLRVFVLLDTYRSLKHFLDLPTILAVTDDNGVTYRCHDFLNHKTHPALICTRYALPHKE